MSKTNIDSEIVNWYEIIKKEKPELLIKTENPNYDYHGLNLHMRAIISGGSGTGKSQFLLSLIKMFSDKSKNKQKKGTFYSIHIFHKMDEPIYTYLASLSNQVHLHKGLMELKIDELDEKKQHLIIFDDMILEKMKPMEEAFIRIRKKNASVVILTQDFFKVSPLIRKQLNYVFILKINGKRELNLIMSEFAHELENKQQLQRIYKYATSEKFCPLTICLEEHDVNKRFRKGVLETIDINEFK